MSMKAVTSHTTPNWNYLLGFFFLWDTSKSSSTSRFMSSSSSAKGVSLLSIYSLKKIYMAPNVKRTGRRIFQEILNCTVTNTPIKTKRLIAACGIVETYCFATIFSMTGFKQRTFSLITLSPYCHS